MELTKDEKDSIMIGLYDMQNNTPEIITDAEIDLILEKIGYKDE